MFLNLGILAQVGCKNVGKALRNSEENTYKKENKRYNNEQFQDLPNWFVKQHSFPKKKFKATKAFNFNTNNQLSTLKLILVLYWNDQVTWLVDTRWYFWSYIMNEITVKAQ